MIKGFLEVEFIIYLILAFDEILTTKSYGSEIGLYTSFGCSSISEWFRNVTRDEAYHFKNAMEVIRKNHSEGICEIPRVIDSFIYWDLERNGYDRTFVLGHDFYSKEFHQEGGFLMKNYFDKTIK